MTQLGGRKSNICKARPTPTNKHPSKQRSNRCSIMANPQRLCIPAPFMFKQCMFKLSTPHHHHSHKRADTAVQKVFMPIHALLHNDRTRSAAHTIHPSCRLHTCTTHLEVLAVEALGQLPEQRYHDLLKLRCLQSTHACSQTSGHSYAFERWH